VSGSRSRQSLYLYIIVIIYKCMDFDLKFQKAMNKLGNKDKFKRQIFKAGARPRKIKRDSFIKNLERIHKSLKRRKINTKDAVSQLRMLID